MHITVLGNNGPYPGAGGACSGYLVRDGDSRIVIDFGSGVLSNLQRFEKLEDLDAIILTHLHSDHMSDMMVLRYAVDILIKRGFEVHPIDVFAPDSPEDEYRRLNIPGIFNLKTIDSGKLLKFGDIAVSFCPMTHPVKSFAVALEKDGRRFVFSGDTNWNEDIIAFARGSHLLLLDAGLASRDKTETAPHLTALECGIVAKRAGAKRLLLTHFWPGYDVRELLKEAAENFPDVEAAKFLETYEV